MTLTVTMLPCSGRIQGKSTLISTTPGAVSRAPSSLIGSVAMLHQPLSACEYGGRGLADQAASRRMASCAELPHAEKHQKPEDRNEHQPERAQQGRIQAALRELSLQRRDPESGCPA